MKSINLVKNLSAVVLLLAVMFSFNSCAKRIAFQTSPYVPAAEGRVKVKKDNNNNYRIGIAVRHLVDSRQLVPARDNYVVWTETESNGVKNVGQMTSSKRLFSKKFKASLDAVSPFKPTRVFITAEDNGNVQYPGPQVVLSTRSFYW